MSQSQEAVTDKHRDGQAPGTASMPYSRASHSTPISSNRRSSDRQTVGWLLYRLSGLLALQCLYSSLIVENRKLKAQRSKQDAPSIRVKGQLQRNNTATSAEAESTASVAFDQADVSDANNSLFTHLYRSMGLRLARSEQMTASAERMDAGGLIKVRH